MRGGWRVQPGKIEQVDKHQATAFADFVRAR